MDARVSYDSGKGLEGIMEDGLLILTAVHITVYVATHDAVRFSSRSLEFE